MGGNKHKFSTDERSDDGEPPFVLHRVPPFPPPLWRFRPPLATSGMVRAIKNQIIPRIALAFRSVPPPTAPGHFSLAADISPFLDLVLDADHRAAETYVEDLAKAGSPVSNVLLRLFAPTARRLGELWEEDAVDFADVTLAVSRLHLMMRQLAENSRVLSVPTTKASALLTTVANDQHCFGLSMAAEFFRRGGWNLSLGPFATPGEFESLLQERWFDVVGFSVSSDRGLGELADEIQIVRRRSKNRRVGIVLGGPLVMERPELAASVGADMVSVDVTIAPRHAQALAEVMKGRN